MNSKQNDSKFTWEDDDDEIDYRFLHPRLPPMIPMNRSSTSYNWTQSSTSGYDVKQAQISEEKNRIQEQTLMGTNASLGLIYDSEQSGIQTAEDLVRQREQLENVDEKLTEVNRTMRISQRYISSMKSVLGGIVNHFRKAPAAYIPRNCRNVASIPPLQEVISKKDEAITPGIKQKSYQNVKTTPAMKPEDDLENKINENLDQMCCGLDRLKGLAIGLSDEIDGQNVLLDNISAKASKADTTIGHQNVLIRKILRK